MYQSFAAWVPLCYVWLVPVVPRRWFRIPRTSHRQWWAVMWVLVIKLLSPGEQPVLVITKPLTGILSSLMHSTGYCGEDNERITTWPLFWESQNTTNTRTITLVKCFPTSCEITPEFLLWLSYEGSCDVHTRKLMNTETTSSARCTLFDIRVRKNIPWHHSPLLKDLSSLHSPLVIRSSVGFSGSFIFSAAKSASKLTLCNYNAQCSKGSHQCLILNPIMHSIQTQKLTQVGGVEAQVLLGS